MDSPLAAQLLSYWPYAAAGFVAQFVDGALGMGYGVTSTTALLAAGLSPLAASSSVHASEVATTGMSAFWHMRFGNVDRELLKKLILPGILGGVVGAYFLTRFPGQHLLKPLVAVYLLAMGVRIVVRGLGRPRPVPPGARPPRFRLLGLAGGFLDSVGGGGWGPIVTATISREGMPAHKVVGSVNAAEFLVTLCQTGTFVAAGGIQRLDIVAALIVGGSLSAPLAAYLCRRLPQRRMTVAVGALNSLLSLRTLAQAAAKALALAP